MSYKYHPDKPVVIYEIYVPVCREHRKLLTEILDRFRDPAWILEAPEVKRVVARLVLEGKPENSLSPEIFAQREAAVLSDMRLAVGGYSIYQVDGRFVSETGVEDEPSWVVRLIIHDPHQEKGARAGFMDLAKLIVRNCIAKRLSASKREDQIWFIEYEQCRLERWTRG
ncbi:MAG: hypothetical protein ABSE73_30680 [Planctomycetota bacterium]